jgi:NAD(P)-dependent dehydrogenase (short-subunit alcohol dehydrogenase family)
MAAAILIAGANRGLGFEFASQYLADGWRVFAACRNPDAASKLRCLAQDTGGMLKIVAMDVTDAESVRNAATQLKDVAIDVLINSAGIAGASGQKTGNVDYESWAHVFNVNTMGPLRVLATLRQKGTLCDLHPKIVGGRPGAGLQLARRPTGSLRRLHSVAKARRLDGVADAL